MKKMTWIFAVLLVALLASGFTTKKVSGSSLKAKKADCVLEDLATSGLGDVKYSILSQTQFQAVNGPEWVLLGGQSKIDIEAAIPSGHNSVFEYITDPAEYNSVTALPNALGVFLRAKDHSAGKNPDGDLRIGVYQDDTFKSHTHGIGARYWPAAPGDYSNTHHSYGDGVQSLATGDAETRSKNITVNIFVKVKRKCLDDMAITKINVAEARITTIEDDFAQNVCDTCIGDAESTLPEQHVKFACYKNEVDLYEAAQKQWSVSCVARTVGSTKKILMQIGTENRTQEENDYLSHLDNQYPYYNVISTTLPYYKRSK